MNDTLEIATESDMLIEQLANALGDTASIVTIDTQDVRPIPGKVAVIVIPPTITYPSWHATPDLTWKACIVAGTYATQTASLNLIYQAIEKLAEHDVNIVKAEPVGYQLDSGTTISAYEITFGTITI